MTQGLAIATYWLSAIARLIARSVAAPRLVISDGFGVVASGAVVTSKASRANVVHFPVAGGARVHAISPADRGRSGESSTMTHHCHSNLRAV